MTNITQADSLLKNISIILISPKYPENIGSAARALHNMGLGQLVLVNAGNLDLERVNKTATHNASHLIDKIQYHESLDSVRSSHSLLIGTTARCGRQRQIMAGVEQLAERSLSHLRQGRVGILFGPENNGIANDDLMYCGLVTSITTAGFSSLNLAQAVAITCYEMRKGLLRLQGEEGPDLHQARAATPQELGAMYDEAEAVLKGLDCDAARSLFVSRFRALKQLLGRIELSAKEAKMIKDVCRQMDFGG